MSKLAFITDTHWGNRSDNVVFLDYAKKFLNECFFPYIDEHNIKRIVHGGDLVERRKYININTASRLRRDFLNPINEREIDMDIIAGNHDVFYKDTNYVNALDELVSGSFPRFKVHIRPTEIEIDNTKIILLPWINQENRKRTFNLIKKTKAQICFGHLDLTGFEMHRGVIQRDGEDPELFGKFDVVLTGHYHHKSNRGNIHYLGSPMQFDWHDYNDPKGFHIFDTDTREIDFIENPLVIFKKIWYNDHDKTMDEVVYDFNFDSYAGCFVKLIIEEKTNPYWFDIFVENLEAVGVSDLQIVEDHMNFDMMADEDIVSETEDTFTIFKKTIEQMDNVDKEGLVGIISEIYQEALSME